MGQSIKLIFPDLSLLRSKNLKLLGSGRNSSHLKAGTGKNPLLLEEEKEDDEEATNGLYHGKG